MNRTFRTVLIADRSLIAADEATTPAAQSGGIAGKQQTSSKSEFSAPRSRLFVMLSAALAVMSASGTAATLPDNCAALGGSYADGVCSFVGLSLGSSGINGNWVLTSGDALIKGGDADSTVGVSFGALGAGNATVLENAGSGVFTIQGGNGSGSNGIEYGGNDFAEFSVRNSASGAVIVRGSEASPSNGILHVSSYSGKAELENLSDGQFLIIGGTAADSSGIGYGTDNATSIYRNSGTGSFTLSGGSGTRCVGMYFGSLGGSGRTELINEGSGTFVITGGAGDASHGIYMASNGGSTTYIENSSNGDFRIIGGSNASAQGMYEASKGGTTLIVNSGSGDFLISASETSSANGFYYGASSGHTTLTNSGTGTLTVTGGASNSSGIGLGLAGSSPVLELINTGLGTLTVKGGNSPSSFGIYSLSGEGSGSAVIANRGSGRLTVTGGGAGSAYGILYGSQNGSTLRIENSADGVLTVSGGTASGAYGITHATLANATSSVINSGPGELIVTGGTESDAYGFLYGSVDGGTVRFENTGLGTLTFSGSAAGSGAAVYRASSGGSSAAEFTNAGSGKVVFIGGSNNSAYAAVSLASDGGSSVLRNTGDGDFIIGGGMNAFGHAVSNGAAGGSTRMENAGAGTFEILGSESSSANGIYYGAVSSSLLEIENSGAGALLVSGKSENSSGIGIAASDSASEFRMINSGTGRVSVTGGEQANSNGIYTLAEKTGGQALLANRGSGEFRIAGGAQSGANGSYLGVILGGSVSLSNESGGIFSITGGSARSSHGIQYLSRDGGSTATITNSGSGLLSVSGGSAGEACGIGFGALAGASAVIENTGTGNLQIIGGTSDGASGMVGGANSGASLVIRNTGSGLEIRGSDRAAAVGIESAALESGTQVRIENHAGVLTIAGGAATGAHGIEYGAADSGSLVISNAAGATMKIAGNDAAGSFGIFQLNTGGSASVINSGIIELGSRAFGNFGAANSGGEKHFQNLSGATVVADVGALYEGGTTYAETVGGTNVLKFTTAAGTAASTTYQEGSPVEVTNASGWTMKNDWKTNASFQDGGHLVIRGVTEGTSGARAIERIFREYFGSGTTVEFDKLPGSAVLPALPFGVINNVLSSNPGASFYDTDIEQTGTLVVGEASGIASSAGFRSVYGTDSIVVRQGHSLRLIGDSTKILSKTGTADVVGTLTVEVDSRFKATGAINVTGGTFAVRGKVDSPAASVASGLLGVYAGASAHFDQLDSAGMIGNNGTLVAESGTVTGTVKSSGLTVLGNYEGSAGSTFGAAQGSAVFVESFKSDGVVRVGNATLVIGSAAKERYLIEHPEDAKKIVEAGGSVSTAVMEAIAASATAETSSFRLERSVSTAETPGSAQSGTEGVVGREPSADDFELDYSQEAQERNSESQVRHEADRSDPATDAEASSEQVAEIDAEDRTPDDDTATDQNATTGAEKTDNPVTHEPIFLAARNAPKLIRATEHGATVFAAWDEARENAAALIRASGVRLSGLTAGVIAGVSELDSYRVKRNGIRVGLQRSDEHLTLGAQAAYADGKVKFGTERSRTESSFGVYGRYDLGDAFISGFAGYGHGKTEAEEASDIRTDSLFGGIMLGADVKVENMIFTPYIGMTAYRITADETNKAKMIEFPIGLSVKGTLSTSSGWTLKPSADVRLVIGNGDRTVHTVESGFAAESAFAGRHRTEAAIGLSAEKDSFSIDVGYRGAVGAAGFRSHGMNLRILYTF